MTLRDVLEPNNLRLAFASFDVAHDLAVDLREDLSFVRTLVRTLGIGDRDERVRVDGPIFEARRPLFVPRLAGKRIAVVASGGSGATAALCGVRRAFEEAGIEPAVISACSGSVLFASLWACGLSSDEIARFWLGMRARDYLDPSWRDLAAALPRRLRGWAGLLRGEAIERSYASRLGDRTLGSTSIPLAAVVWNIDHNRVEYLSSRATPTMSVARAARIAISIPLMVQPVRQGGTWYGDGGIVDVFPTVPLEAEAPIDLVLGTNSYLAERFDGELVADWMDRSWSVLRAAGQVRYAVYLELARARARQLGDRLELIQPVPYTEVRGAKFYESFLDRRAWPRYMRLGHEHARAALERMEARCAGSDGRSARALPSAGR